MRMGGVGRGDSPEFMQHGFSKEVCLCLSNSGKIVHSLLLRKIVGGKVERVFMFADAEC